jgi:hypothetical protein
MATIDDNHAYLMPAHFGGQVPDGQPTIYDDTTALTVFYTSDPDALASLLPEEFELNEPEIMVSMMENRGVRWMGGEPYNIVAVNVSARHGNIVGWYSLVVWENKATPIIPGREQTGIPKIFGEVESIRRYPDATARSWSHYAGHTHVDLAVSGVRTASSEEEALIRDGFSTMDWFGYRYIPKTGLTGAESAQAILFPQSFEISRVEVGEPSLSWSVPPLHKNPTQAHIIGALAAMPIREYSRPAVILDARAILHGEKARVL